MRRKLLIVDDEKGIVDMLAGYFAAWYDVLTAYSGGEALQKVAACPDLILLDINMPGMDGLAICRNIREYVTCPILFLTARVESADQIVGFRAGADDYIVKPFDLDELGARVAAHLRREQRRQGSMTVRFFGELAIDYGARTAAVNGVQVPFSRREFDIVELLSLNAGQVLTGSGSMRLSGDMTGKETATRSWNISARSGRSLQCIRAIVISIQSGGVVIDGTVEEYGTQTFLFFALSALPCGCAVIDLRGLPDLCESR